jgi:O-antigen/teichoic acid export membrane protein
VHLNGVGETEWTDRRFIRDVLFANLPAPFLRLRSYIWLVVFSRTVGLSGVGAWALFDTTLSLATTGGTMLLGHAMMRFASGERDRRETSIAIATVLLAVTAACSVISLFLLIFGGSLSDAIFHRPVGRQLLLVIAAVLIFDAVFEEIKGFYRARRENRVVAGMVLTRALPEGLLMVAAAFAFRSIVAVAWTYCACAMIAAMLALACLIRSKAVRQALPSVAVLRQYLGYSVPLLPGVLSTVASMRADRYIIGYFCNLETIGIYAVCTAIAAINMAVLAPISDVLLPELADLHDRFARDALCRRFAGVQKAVLGFAGGVALICLVFPSEAMRFATSVAHPAGPHTLRLLGLQGIITAIAFLYGLLLSIRLRVWIKSLIALATGVLVVGLDLFLIPRFGLPGAALAQVIAAGVALCLTLIPTWDMFKESFDKPWLIRLGIAFGSVAAIGLFSTPDKLTAINAALRLGAGLSGYFVMLIVAGYISHGDLQSLRENFR